MWKFLLAKISFLTVVVFISGCNSTGSYTSNEHFSKNIIGPIEEKEISYQGVFRNPIIIVHGFEGANLVDKKTGKDVWGDFTLSEGFDVSPEMMRDIAVPMELGKPLCDIKDNVIPNGTLDTVKVNILGITFKENAYLNLVNILQNGGYQAEGFPMQAGRSYNTLFQFAYDWRRDLPWNAKKLHKFILEKRKYMQEQYQIMYGIKDYNVQFNIIAHSMGGLLSRYYLRFGSADLPPEGKKADVTWDGSKFLERLIIVGTPNAGYLDTVLEMQRGRELPPLPPAVIGTWATYYQMMPFPTRNSVIYSDSKKPVDLFDINVWKKLKWGLADPEQSEILKVLLPKVKTDGERRKIALDHLEKCLKRAKRFIEVMSIKSRPPKDVQLYLVTGNSVKTTRLAEVDPQTGNLKVIKMAPGDGKVSESSAMFDDRAGQVWKPFFSSPIHWHNIMQLRAAHMGLTTAPAFKDNLLFLLNAVPSPKQLEELKKGNKL